MRFKEYSLAEIGFRVCPQYKEKGQPEKLFRGMCMDFDTDQPL